MYHVGLSLELGRVKSDYYGVMGSVFQWHLVPWVCYVFNMYVIIKQCTCISLHCLRVEAEKLKKKKKIKKLQKWIFLLVKCQYFSLTPRTFLVSNANCTTQALGLESSVYSKRHPKAAGVETLHVWKKGSRETQLIWAQQQQLYLLTLVFWEPMREMEIIRKNLKGWYFVPCFPYKEQIKLQ